MALFRECSLQCARKVLDTADIVKEAIYRKEPPAFPCSMSATAIFSRAAVRPPIKQTCGNTVQSGIDVRLRRLVKFCLNVR
jgi:hypothetical protein